MKKPKVASFFAGIGGFDLGFEQAGFEVDFQCEILPFCRSVLQHHWSGIPCATDITSLHPDAVSEADVWCGGFPCQDLSVARGSKGRHGLNGSRSGLFFRLAELAKIRKPRIILMENVHGLLNANNGKDFAELLYTLSELNYAVSWRLLNSRYFGVPQSRPRIYICAWLNNPISAGNVLFENRIPIPLKNERAAFLSTSWQQDAGPIPPKLAFCLAATSGRHTGTDWSRTYIPYIDAVRRLTPLECERLQGFPDHWTKLHLADIDVEKSDSLRYHALGNAVSVAVVKWVAERIREQLIMDASSDLTFNTDKFIINSLEKWPVLHGSKMISNKLSAVRDSDEKAVWPNAGIVWQDTFIANGVYSSPCEPVHSDLIDIVERNKPDLRYFLSPNAAEGILRRVDSQNRHLFPHLRSALERLSERPVNKISNTNTARQCEITLPGLLECV
ncbi:DNA cytosine methyltransferase [Methylovulum psychrotolerans]|uniref:DNA cytosine methyltransferase n=1 Tax=Methylovulum psychrotolerans TaxID=1704499 RepID=UPI001BFF6DBD|nr:DNA cytosine methyltransferase [Methylovulum psychrotolerans]MBT9100062.1 DNA cytosine methyltransferase [Methylovulum psychrotolerans]